MGPLHLLDNHRITRIDNFFFKPFSNVTVPFTNKTRLQMPFIGSVQLPDVFILIFFTMVPSMPKTAQLIIPGSVLRVNEDPHRVALQRELVCVY